MAGIYVHIPFCKQACYYCNFHFSVSRKNKTALVNAIVKELQLRKDYLNGEQIKTIYFGGGTPSILSVKELSLIISEIYKLHNITDKPEITIEANPDDLSFDKLTELKNETPVNRLSIGVQSFFDEDLKYLNRFHDAKTSLDAIKNAQEAGFKNITVDLIYGIPALTNDKWIANLNKSFELEIPHLSCYYLTVEPKTPLDLFINKGKYNKIDEEIGVKHFELLLELTKQNNFIHYEISNFGKEGFLSRHNISYWTGQKYLGVGPSAHSFNGAARHWNTRNNTDYIKCIENDKLPLTEEILSLTQRYNEYILTSIRTIWGTDLSYIYNNFGEQMFNYCVKESKPHIENNNLTSTDNILNLTHQGKLFADKIASDLFIIEPNQK